MRNLVIFAFSFFALLLITTFLLAPTTKATFPGTNGKIVFSSDRDGNPEIYTMNADGTNQTRLTNNSDTDDLPVWSPDLKKIAFVRFENSSHNIYVMNADGTYEQNLTSSPV